MKNHQLVTVVVTAYNCGQFVEEALDSVKAQTYDNLELIITDDCSTDDTVAKCKNWLRRNPDRFARVELITSEVNTGVANNLNRALYAAKGEWIKFFSGDDVLKPDTVKDLIEFASKQQNASLIHGAVELINEKSEILVIPKVLNKYLYPTFNEQLRGNRIKGPSVFYKRNDLISLGGFNPDFGVEDYYIYLKLLNSGYSIFYIGKIIAQYRIHQSNFSNDRLYQVREVLKSQLAFRDNKGFFLGHYVFCRKLIVVSCIQDRNPVPIIRTIIKINPFTMLVLFDYRFWLPIMKFIVKQKILKRNLSTKQFRSSYVIKLISGVSLFFV